MPEYSISTRYSSSLTSSNTTGFNSKAPPGLSTTSATVSMFVEVVFSMMLADRLIDNFPQRVGTVSETTLGYFSEFAYRSVNILSGIASPHTIVAAIAAIRILLFHPLARGPNCMVKGCVNKCGKMKRMTTAYPDIHYPVVISNPQRLHPESGQASVDQNPGHHELYVIDNSILSKIQDFYCALENWYSVPYNFKLIGSSQPQHSTCLQLQSPSFSLLTMSAFAIIVSAMAPTESATWELSES
jgi:hypothetical protein